jgi:hypothetical protein
MLLIFFKLKQEQAFALRLSRELFNKDVHAGLCVSVYYFFWGGVTKWIIDCDPFNKNLACPGSGVVYIPSGIVFACGVMVREIDSRQGKRR